jgi:predicted ATP-dependent endonuclease of OLD family
MKLVSLSIRDFRGIERLNLSFQDELGLIRDCVPIVGPNTSGKTTILDAIALGVTAVVTTTTD